MFVDFLRSFFLVGTKQLTKHDKSIFRLSTLRALVALTLIISFAAEIHTGLRILFDGEYHFFIINSCYLLLLFGILFFSRRYTSGTAFLFVIVLATTGILLLTQVNDVNAVKYALICLYSLPLITRLLFNFKSALVVSLANLGSFFLILESSNLTSIDGSSADNIPAYISFYFQLLIFVTLNIGLPLAASRIIYSLEANNTHMESLNRRLNRNYALYEEIFEHTGTPTLLCNKNGKVLKVNQQARDLLSTANQYKIENSQIQDWLTPLNTTTGKSRSFWQSNTTECTLKTDKNVHIEVHRSSLTTHGHFILHLQNITHLRALQQELESTQQTNSRLVHFDALTRLPNAQHFCNQVNQRLLQERKHTSGSMFIIKISQFKLLNKKYGKDNANRIILNFARLLRSKLSDQTIIARLRGVKFACFIPLGQAYLIQRNLSTLINSVLPSQLKIDGKLLNMDYKVGVAYYRTDGRNAEELLEHCEMALEYSTSADRLSYYDHQLEDKLIQEHKLGLELSAAIKRNDITLWLQPQVSPNGQICSFEALARWKQESGQYVSPIIFIRIAEKLGLLPQLAENLLRELVSILSQWHEERIHTPVAFNLAGQELMNDMFFALLMSLSADHPWLGTMLELEITETSPVMTHPLIHKRLRALSQYGFSIAIDDFGTGQASMGQLIDIPANILKIDRRFVAPLPKDKRHLDIVKSTIQLAQSLKMKVIAEGIETKEQANLLISLGCNTLQGYYFGKPSPIAEWTANNHQKAKELRMVY